MGNHSAILEPLKSHLCSPYTVFLAHSRFSMNFNQFYLNHNSPLMTRYESLFYIDIYWTVLFITAYSRPSLRATSLHTAQVCLDEGVRGAEIQLVLYLL